MGAGWSSRSAKSVRQDEIPACETGDQLAARERVQIAPVAFGAGIVIDIKSPRRHQLESDITIAAHRCDREDIRTVGEKRGAPNITNYPIADERLSTYIYRETSLGLTGFSERGPRKMCCH